MVVVVAGGQEGCQQGERDVPDARLGRLALVELFPIPSESSPSDRPAASNTDSGAACRSLASRSSLATRSAPFPCSACDELLDVYVRGRAKAGPGFEK